MYLFSIFITSIGLVKYNNWHSYSETSLSLISILYKVAVVLVNEVRLSKASNIVR